MLNSRARDVFYHFFDVTWHSMSKEPLDKIGKPEMSEIAAALKYAFDDAQKKKERIAKSLDKGNAAVQLNSIEIKGDHLVLLIGYADTDGADPVLLNIETGVAKVIEKKRNEGLAYSSHCIIAMKPSAKTGLYDVMLEKVPGATRSIILPFINIVIKQLMLQELAVGKKKEIKIYPRIEMLSKANSSVKKAVKQGYVDEIEFVKYSKTSALADVGGVVQEVSTLKWKLKKLTDAGLVNKAIQLASSIRKSKGYDELKVRFKSGQKTDTIPLSEMSLDAGDYVFNQRMSIKLKEAVPQYTQNICAEIRDEMVKLINADN